MAWEWGDGAGLIGGVAGVFGVLVAWASLSKAKEANKTAKQGLELSRKANEIADAAKNLSDQANALSREANQESATSNELAHEANRIALGANRLAREANDLFHQQERRVVESHDVHWDGQWVQPGVYRLLNDGTHTAYDVSATVVVDNEQKRVTIPQLAGGEHFTLDFPQARLTYRVERRRQEEEQQRRSRYSLPPVIPSFHYIEERVYWKTELDTPKEHITSHNMSGLGNFD
ncbi:hypothetical protein [Streptomyces sp. CAI 127]|uniref:hypothetical protein n=1 Tax=Streptomyces sp. CAI 127 TaxID=1076397 RepID=UPI0015875530|nr:hypothetical protein [Streptomyces sp. CAI 127]NUW04308.1 hypothetical protein [Streptomyces sp. CAI 127]